MNIGTTSTAISGPSARLFMALAAALAFALGAAGTGNAATRTDVKQIVVEEALATPVPPSLALAVAKVESDFQPAALSPKGARGVMQIMPATAKGEFGVDAEELWNPRLNIQLGIDFLAQLIERYDGRWDLALSHYNSGRIKRSGGHAEPLPATRKYVAAVLRWQRRYAAQANVWRAEPPPVTGWRPAKTRAARLAQPIPRRAAAAESTPLPRRKTVAPTPLVGLDDFSGSIHERRRLVRHTLDDFTERNVATTE